MIAIEHVLGPAQIILQALALAPGQTEDPVQIIAHNGGFRRHRAHLAQFLELGIRLGARFLGQLGFGQALFQLGEFLAAVIALAQLALDRLHLLIEIVFALGLLHLSLHARADLLFHLQHADLAFHQAQHAFQAAGDVGLFQQALFLVDLDGQVRSDAVSQLGGFLDLRQRGQGFRWHLLVQFNIVLEFRGHGAHQRFQLGRIAGILVEDFADGFVIVFARRVVGNLHAHAAFDQHLHRAVGQFQQLQY